MNATGLSVNDVKEEVDCVDDIPDEHISTS